MVGVPSAFGQTKCQGARTFFFLTSPAALGNIGSRLSVWVHRTETASAVFSLVAVVVILTSCLKPPTFRSKNKNSLCRLFPRGGGGGDTDYLPY